MGAAGSITIDEDRVQGEDGGDAAVPDDAQPVAAPGNAPAPTVAGPATAAASDGAEGGLHVPAAATDVLSRWRSVNLTDLSFTPEEVSTMAATLPEEKRDDARAALELGRAIVGGAGAAPRGAPLVGAGGLTVDLRLAANRAAHHTDVFDDDPHAVILRRGQPWTVGLRVAGAARGAITGVLVDATDASNTFRVRVEPSTAAGDDADADASGVYDVFVPATAPVGRFTLELSAGGGAHTARVAATVLFNAWCADDAVHLPDAAVRGEFVLNEAGTLYKGFPFYVQPFAWQYDQFGGAVARCVLDVLLPRVAAGVRGDPALLARRFSALVNGNDARQDSAEHFCRLGALLFTATAWIFIPAYCFALP